LLTCGVYDSRNLGLCKTAYRKELIRMRHFRMNVFAYSKMLFNIVRPNVRGRVLQLISATGGLIGLLVYPASHS